MGKKKIFQYVFSIFLTLALVIAYFFIFKPTSHISLKNVISVVLLIAIYLTIYYLYRLIFNVKIEQGHVPLYSRRWFIRLVCGFVTIAFDLFQIYPLFDGFEQTSIDTTLIAFAASYGSFIFFVGVLELIYLEMKKNN